MKQQRGNCIAAGQGYLVINPASPSARKFDPPVSVTELVFMPVARTCSSHVAESSSVPASHIGTRNRLLIPSIFSFTAFYRRRP
jgi:hypothetical protein